MAIKIVTLLGESDDTNLPEEDLKDYNYYQFIHNNNNL